LTFHSDRRIVIAFLVAGSTWRDEVGHDTARYRRCDRAKPDTGASTARTPPRFLRPGDELVSSIAGIVEMRHTFIAASSSR